MVKGVLRVSAMFTDKKNTRLKQAVFATLLFGSLHSVVIAGPTGGQVVGGTGSISQSGSNTTINQSSQNMAIDWQTYNINADERVQYLQPNTSSVSLNRILSNSGSTIAGRIDANGHVILVNPNGIFFTPTSVLNVGGIIASGLQISPTDFMNGNYIFNEVIGSDGFVINSGTINASLGGNVALIGRQVENDGLIVANLGTVTLAAGKQAVLTFDQGGLLGVRVSQEILQEEIGIDPAVANNGEIDAEGGRVLLTASTSQDVFSQAVNTNGIVEATSVVVHEDGSFTLGGGADVINTGSIDTSTSSSDQNVGRIVLIGENVTSSGELHADSIDGNGGEIEVHSQDTTLLTENSVTSARSEENGEGGIVKVLGDKVGLFDQAIVDVSGASGGGEALIGGDYQGKNAKIRNSSITIMNHGTSINADALTNGQGGKVILWSDNSTYFGGNITVKGGDISGGGGFIETSGLQNLIFYGETDRSAKNGSSGLLLLDPLDIFIDSTGSSDNSAYTNQTINFSDCTGNGCSASSDVYTISAQTVVDELANGAVTMQANRDIVVNSSINASSNTNSLTLQAGDDVLINQSLDLGSGALFITSGDNGCGSSCANGGGDGVSGNDLQINANIITTGQIILTSNDDDVRINAQIGNTTIQPSSLTINAADDISSNTSGSITTFGLVDLNANSDSTGGGDIILSAPISTNGGDFITSGDNYDGATFLGGSVFINTGTGRAIIDMTGSVLLGRMVIGGSLEVTAGDTDTNGNSISQGTFNSSYDILDVTGISTFTSSVNNGDIALTNSNILQSSIDISTSGDYQADASLVNTATTTIINTVSVDGNLTINASESLTLTDVVTSNATDSGGSQRTTSIRLNFGQGSAGNFTATDSSITTGNLNNDIVNIEIAGGGGSDTFILDNASISTNRGDIDINANGAADSIDTGTAIVNAVSGNVTISGNAGNDTITISSNSVSASGAVTYNGNAGDDIVNISVTTNANIQGGDDNDTFNIQNDDVSVTLYGGEGGTDSDRVVGNNSTNTNSWSITGDSSGTLQNIGIVNFNEIENLQGNNGIDQFVYNGLLAGVINGGAGANDTLDITLDGVTVEIGDRSTSNINVIGIEVITANSAAAQDTIIGNNIDNTWNVSGDSTSVVAPTGNSLPENTVNFINFTRVDGGVDVDMFNISNNLNWTLNGGDGADQFDLTSNYSGNLNGGAGNDVFRLNSTGLIVTSVLNGGPDNDTVIAANEINYWSIDSTDGGQIYSDSGRTSQTVDFISIETLRGNASADEFLITGNGEITQLLDGGSDNNNTIIARNIDNEWNITDLNEGVLYIDNAGSGFGTAYINNFTNIQNITGGDLGDSFVIGSIGVIDGVLNGALGANVLIGRDAANEWEVNNPNSGRLYIDDLNNTPGNYGTAYVNSFNNIQSLVGGTAGDRFEMGLSGTIDSIDGNNLVNNTLVARQGVQNTWSFTGPESGSLADVGGDYVNNFTNIQAFVGGGVGGEWANLSATAQVNAANYFGFEGIIGSGTNTLVGQDGIVNNWSIQSVQDQTGASTDGVNDGIFSNTNGSIRFVDFAILQGGNAVDNFVIDATGSMSSTGEIRGGDTTNTNTITGRGVANTWTITSNNAGSVAETLTASNPYITSFTDIQQLYGGAGVDTFEFTGGVVDVDGGSNIDTLSITAPGNQIIELTDTNTVNLNVYQIETITANAATSNTIIGNSSVVTNTWNLNGARSGTVSDGFTPTVSFINIDQAEGAGGTTVDNFQLSGNFTGLIHGGTGTANDTLLVTMQGDQVIELGDRINGNINVYEIETITANPNNNIQTELISDSNAALNNWTINGPAGGSINSDGLNTSFSNIDNVTGGTGNDIFNLLVDNFTGLIHGGAGTGTDNLLITVVADQIIEIGNSINSNLNIYQIEDLSANASSVNELIGDSGVATNNWTVDGARNGTVTGVNTTSFSNIDNLTGAGGNTNDSFVLNTNGFTGLIDGGAGSGLDTLTISTTGDQTIELGDRVNGNLNVFQLETITANINFTNELIADSAAGILTNTWTIDGSNSGRIVSGLNTTDFINITDLTGTATAADNFTINGAITSNITGVIDGGTGTGIDSLTINAAGNRVVELGDRRNTNLNVVRVETITANTSTTNELISDSNATINTWLVNNNRSGSVNDGSNSTSFSNFDILTGGSTEDRFTVNNLAAITTINGGTGAGNNVLIEAGTVGTVNLGTGDDDFLITGGQVTGAVNGQAGNDNITVSGGTVGSIDMGTGDDNFTITAGSVLGTVNGNDGNDTFTNSGGSVGSLSGDAGIDYIVDTRSVVDITVGADAGGFEGITAANNNGILRAQANEVTDWVIDGNNSGSVSDSAGESLAFSGFSTLIGGNDVDNFDVQDNGSISGLISGNGSDDTLDVILINRTLPLGQINFDGGGDAGDIITIAGAGGIYNEAYNVNQSVSGQTGTFDQLVFSSPSVVFNLNYRAVASVNDNLQVDNLTINSNNVANTVILGDNTFGATNSTSVTIAYAADSKTNIAVNATNGANISITGAVNIPQTLSLFANNITENVGANITANSLILGNTGIVGVSGDGLSTDVVSLQLNSAGDAYIDELNNLALGGSTNANLEITAGGNISNASDLISSGAVTIRTSGNITLDTNNQLTGALTFAGPSSGNPAGDVTLVNTAATNLSSIESQSLTVTSTGDIYDTGTITVTGPTNLSSNGDITLDDPTNNLQGVVNVGSSASIGALNLTLFDSGSINVGTMNVSGRVVLDVQDQITDGNGGAINIFANTLQIRAVNGISLGGLSGSTVIPGTQVETLDVINSSTTSATAFPTVTIANSGDLTVLNLQNDGNINLYNIGNITIDPTPSGSGGSRGSINANYQGGVDEPVYAGDVAIYIPGSNGSISALGSIDPTAPEIIAENLSVVIPGTFGSPARYMHLSVHDTFFLSAQPPGYVVYYNNQRPNETGPTSLVVFSGLTGLSTQQLIDLETLGEVDPAVFTEVRNYNYDDVAIKLPADQRYTVDDEEDEKKKKKKQLEEELDKEKENKNKDLSLLQGIAR